MAEVSDWQCWVRVQRGQSEGEESGGDSWGDTKPLQCLKLSAVVQKTDCKGQEENGEE